jgi:hypothetical protein
MIGVSMCFFMIGDSIENLETQLGVAAASFVENCLFIAALALIGMIYLAFFSKPCPVCAEQLSPTASDRRHCGYTWTLRPGRTAGTGCAADSHFIWSQPSRLPDEQTIT